MPGFSRTAFIVGLVLAAGAGSAQLAQQVREVSGSVKNKQDAPVKGAIVQLENQDSHTVQTYLTDGDGSFHFKNLSKDTDYQVSASLNGARSKGVFVSKFDDSASKFVKLVLQP